MINNSRPILKINPLEKDIQLTTNPCQSDRNCLSKGALGKFFRKQDMCKIQRKKKPSIQQKSLLCYLTPKNCDQSSKLIKSKLKENCSQVNISSFLSIPMQSASTKTIINKSIVTTSIVCQGQGMSKNTSIDKYGLKKQLSNGRIILGQKNRNQLNTQGNTNRDTVRNKSSVKNLRFSEAKEEELQATLLSKAMVANYQKQMKKLKNQCQHYCQLLQSCNKGKQQSQNQIKSLNSLINELKTKNSNLSISQQDLSRQILQMNDQINKLNTENNQLKKSNLHFTQEKAKNQEEINYLKESVNELNQRIQLMLDSGNQFQQSLQPLRTPKGKTTLTSFKSPTHAKRINSMCFVSGSMEKIQQQTNEEDNKLLIYELQDQLKYSQVEISMLKRVKLDINKKSEEFQKLQRQNKILKNQIFQIKTNSLIQEQNNKSNLRLPKSHSKSQFATLNNRNFQKNRQRTSRAKEQDNKSESSDTLSLNLSLSSEKEIFRG